MANIKLTDDNWETSGVYDLAESKTQRTINADLKGAIKHTTFVVTGTTLASKTNTIFCTSETDSRITANTNVANVTFLDSDILDSSTFTATTNANGTVTLTGSTRAVTTTAIIECYN